MLLKAIETKNKNFVEKLENLNENGKVEIEPKDGTKSWMDHECLRHSRVEEVPQEEALFFQQLIEKYLDPNSDGNSNPQTAMANKAKVIEGLRDLRNNCAYCYLILNGFWLLIMFTLNLLKPKMVDKIYLDLRFDHTSQQTPPKDSDKYEPVSFCYVMLFAFVLIIQFGAMVWHRVITLTQVIRKTSLLDSNKRTTPPVVCREQNGHLNNHYEGSKDSIEEPKEAVLDI